MLLKLGESHFLKTKYIPAGEHQFFRYFQQFDIFDYNENIFFNKSFIRQVETDFLPSGNGIF